MNMALDAGSVVANIRAKVDGLRAGITTAKDELKGFEKECQAQAKKVKEASANMSRLGDGLTKIGGTITGIGKGLTLAITAPVVGLAGSLIKTGVQFKAFQQEAKQAFGVLLGSSEAAKKHMDDILAFARTTPFAFPDLVDANRKLVAFGMAAKDTHPVMEAIANAVAAMGGGAEDIDQLTDVFARIQSQGKITGMELRRLGEQGINAVTIMANKAGVSIDEMRKMISQGAIDSKMAIDWLVDGIMNGTEGIAGSTVALGGSLGALKNTWAGAMDSLRGAWRWTADEIVGDEMFAKLIEGIHKLTDLVRKLPTFLGPLADTLGTMFSNFIDKLIRLTDWFSRLNPHTRQFYIKLGLIAVAAGPVLMFFGKMITSVGNTIKAFQTINGVIGAAKIALQGVGTATSAASAALGAAGTAAATAGASATAMGGIFAGLAAAGGPILAVVAAIALVSGVVKLYTRAMNLDVRSFGQVASDTFDNMTSKFVDSQLKMLDSQGSSNAEMLRSQIAHYEEMGSLTAEQNAEMVRLQEELAREEAFTAEKRKALMLLKEQELSESIVKEKGKNRDEILKLYGEYHDELFSELERAHNEELETIINHHAEKGTVGSKAFYDDIERAKQQHIERQAEVHRQLGEMLAEYETELAKVGLVYDQELGKIIPIQDKNLKEIADRFAREAESTIEQYGTSSRRAVQAYRRGLQEETPGAEEAARELHSRSRNALKEKLHEAEESGSALGNAFARGISATASAVASAASSIASAASRYLPRSPAKEGPLKKLPNWRAYLTEGLDDALKALKDTYAGLKLPGIANGSQDWNTYLTSGLGRAVEKVKSTISNLEPPTLPVVGGFYDALKTAREAYRGAYAVGNTRLEIVAKEVTVESKPEITLESKPDITNALQVFKDIYAGLTLPAVPRAPEPATLEPAETRSIQIREDRRTEEIKLILDLQNVPPHIDQVTLFEALRRVLESREVDREIDEAVHRSRTGRLRPAGADAGGYL